MVKIKKKPKKGAQKQFQKEAYTQEKQIIPLPAKSDSLLQKKVKIK